LTRYRTPRKKTTNWKGHLSAGAIGIVCLAAGIFLLFHAPEEPPEAPAEAEEAVETTGGALPGAPDEAPVEAPPGSDPGSPRGPRPDEAASAELARSFFGLALLVLGIALPVASVVIEKTSGKKWNRRAGKKHPFKRKI
jgi:hypothetical protein